MGRKNDREKDNREKGINGKYSKERDNNEKNSKEKIEDTTRYGEFIPSFDQWTTSEKSRRRSRYLEEVTEELFPEKDKNV